MCLDVNFLFHQMPVERTGSLVRPQDSFARLPELEVFGGVSEMASSSKPVTPDELAMAQAIVARAHKVGVKGHDMSAGYGAMTDSAKRLRDQRDIELDEAWEPVTYLPEEVSLVKERLEAGSASKQVPFVPEKKDENAKIPLPAGVSSVDDWGSTVCRLPKVSALGLSYKELVAQKEHHKYLTWVQGHGLHRDGRFGDLAAYLERINFSEGINRSSDPTVTFAGSSEKRERK